MPFLTSVTDVLTRRMPDVLSPKSRSVIDYLISGSFFAAGGVFWKRNRSAAVAALLCGSGSLLASLLTNHSGHTSNKPDMNARRNIDLGLAAVMAGIPQLMSFDNEKERIFFLANAVLLTALANMTEQNEAKPYMSRKAPRTVA